MRAPVQKKEKNGGARGTVAFPAVWEGEEMRKTTLA
jgi:hypothetical protein